MIDAFGFIQHDRINNLEFIQSLFNNVYIYKKKKMERYGLLLDGQSPALHFTPLAIWKTVGRMRMNTGEVGDMSP